MANNMNNVRALAKRCGVSTATISRVLNNKPGVSDEVRERVSQVIRECNYTPKMLAQPTRLLGVSIEFEEAFSSWYLSPMLNAIEDQAFAKDYDLVILRNERLRQIQGGQGGYEMYLKQRKISGLIVLLSTVEDRFPAEIARQGFPVVVVNNRPQMAVDHIDSDAYQGSYEATQYLIALGHEHIAFMHFSMNYLSHQERLRGYQDALREAGLRVDPEWFVNLDQAGSTTFEAGFNGLSTLLLRHPEVTAVLSQAETIMQGVVTCLQEMGRSVPGDLSLIAFDDSPMMAHSRPAFTVVKQDIPRIGALAVKRVVECIQSVEAQREPFKMILPNHLVIRQTTGQPRERREQMRLRTV